MNNTFFGKPTQKVIDWLQRGQTTETVGGKWTLHDRLGNVIAQFGTYTDRSSSRLWWQGTTAGGYRVQYGAALHQPIPRWKLIYPNYSIAEADASKSSTAKRLKVTKDGSSEIYWLVWENA